MKVSWRSCAKLAVSSLHSQLAVKVITKRKKNSQILGLELQAEAAVLTRSAGRIGDVMQASKLIQALLGLIKCEHIMETSQQVTCSCCFLQLLVYVPCDVVDINSITNHSTFTANALQPSTCERQNVNLAARMFNDFVVQALVDLDSKHNILHCPKNSVYIKIISTWWDVVNVETPMKGLPKKPYQQPLTKRDTEARRLFWNNCPHGKKFLVTVGKSARKLSLHCGTRATGSLQQQIIVPELRLNYVLLGKFQTDFFEARFG